jgi:hypothetical protein
MRMGATSQNRYPAAIKVQIPLIKQNLMSEASREKGATVKLRLLKN